MYKDSLTAIFIIFILPPFLSLICIIFLIMESLLIKLNQRYFVSTANHIVIIFNNYLIHHTDVSQFLQLNVGHKLFPRLGFYVCEYLTNIILFIV